MKLTTFSDLADKISQEFEGCDEVALRDLILLRLAQEKAVEAKDFVEMARVHRQIVRKEAFIRSVLARIKAEESGRGVSLRDRLEARYAGRAP
jgi:hypothetical protein